MRTSLTTRPTRLRRKDSRARRALLPAIFPAEGRVSPSAGQIDYLPGTGTRMHRIEYVHDPSGRGRALSWGRAGLAGSGDLASLHRRVRTTPCRRRRYRGLRPQGSPDRGSPCTAPAHRAQKRGGAPQDGPHKRRNPHHCGTARGCTTMTRTTTWARVGERMPQPKRPMYTKQPDGTWLPDNIDRRRAGSNPHDMYYHPDCGMPDFCTAQHGPERRKNG